MQVKFPPDAWSVLTRARASGELPYLLHDPTMTEGSYYVVECPESIGYRLRGFCDQRERDAKARIDVAAMRGDHDRDLEREYVGWVHALNAIVGAFGLATQA